MSLLSRNTGGGRRRVAKMAAVFAGTLLAYLVVTAIPAMAVSTCSNAVDTNILEVAVGTDDTVVLDPDGGLYEFSTNGGAFVACGGTHDSADFEWIHVVGSNAGNENFVMLEPGFVAVIDTPNNLTVDLGNGTDTLNLDWGDAPGLPGSDPFPSVASETQLGTSAGGVQVGSAFDVTFFRLDNAETVTVTGDSLAAPGTTDELDDANQDGIAASAGTPVATDDIPAAPAGSDATLNLTFAAGSGNDRLFSGLGNEVFQGGAGSDAISYLGSASGVTVDLAAGTGTGNGTDTLTDVQEAEGSPFDDTLLGSALDNNIRGQGGNDTIDGRAGNDGATPGFLPVGLRGDAGNDTILQGTAADGADLIFGGSNTAAGDTLDYSGRTGALFVQPDGGPVSGEGGCPLATTCEKDNIADDVENFLLGSAADKFVGSGEDEYVVPGAGDDNVDGNGGFDYLSLEDVAGPATFNLITGTATGAGTDTFSDMEGYVGTPGNDTLILGNTPIPNGNSLGDFAAGDGIDTIDASARTQNLIIDLDDFGFDCAPTGCLEVENVIGGSGNDSIQGNDLNNTLIGNDGVDNLFGDNGNDRIEGGLGNDLLDGSAGGDTVVYRHATGGMEINAALGFSSGPDGADSLSSFEIILGSDFNDTIVGGQTAFDLPNKYKGFKGNDDLTGTNSTDLLIGGAGNDSVRAGNGDDIGRGNAGNDVLLGAGGNDVLKGGAGSDTANGQQGFDVCKAETEISCEA